MYYETKFIKLAHDIDDEADLVDYPIIEFFADNVEIGNNKVAVVYNEYFPIFHTRKVTGSKLLTSNEANKLYKEFIGYGYKVVECEITK